MRPSLDPTRSSLPHPATRAGTSPALRRIGVGIALIALAAPASAEPLWQAEIHAGYGLAMSGSGERMSKRATPLTLSALLSFAFNVDPPLAGFAGVVFETLDRSAVGTTAGIKYTPNGSGIHIAGGGTMLVAPKSLFGVSVSGGWCRQQTKVLGLCGDLQITSYFAGDDLADDRTVTQVQLVLGAVFDVR